MCQQGEEFPTYYSSKRGGMGCNLRESSHQAENTKPSKTQARCSQKSLQTSDQGYELLAGIFKPRTGSNHMPLFTEVLFRTIGRLPLSHPLSVVAA